MMNLNITLLNEALLYYVLPISILLFIYCFYLEWNKRKMGKFGIRILFIFTAIISLALLALKPAFYIHQKTKTAILLTKNYSQSQLDSLASNLEEPLLLDYAGFSERSDLPSVSDLNDFTIHYSEISHLYLLGDGIPVYDLGSLPNISLKSLLNSPAEGITEIDLPEEQLENMLFKLSGSFYSNDTSAKWIVLANPGGMGLDSIKITEKGVCFFDLKAQAGKAGNYLYPLWIKNQEGKVLQKEEVPICIKEALRPRILVLNSHPSFESRYLKNYLSEEGYEIMVKSLISKDKVKEEKVNLAVGKQADVILTETYDLLMMDSGYWNLLSPSIQNTLIAALKEGTISIFIFAEENLLQNKPLLLNGFGLYNAAKDTLIFSAPEYGEKEKFSLRKMPLGIQEGMNTIPLLKDGKGNTVMAWQAYGAGKVGLSILEESYPMALSGRKELYKAFWGDALSKISPLQRQAQQWKTSPFPLIKDQPAMIQLEQSEGANNLAFVQTSDSKKTALFFLDNYLIKEYKESKWIPEEKGWHEVYTEKTSGEKQSFYVFEEDSWQALRLKQQLKANQIWQKELSGENHEKEAIDYNHSQMISPWWFYALFLISMSVLWVLEKGF